MEAADVMTQCLPTNTISLLRLVLLFQVLWNVCSTSSIRSSTLQTVYPQRLNSIHFVFSPQDIDWNSWMSLKLKCYLKRPLLLSELLTKFILLERESTLKHFMAQNIHLTLSPDMISIIWHTCVTQFSAQEQSENSNAVDGSVIASKAATISPSSVPKAMGLMRATLPGFLHGLSWRSALIQTLLISYLYYHREPLKKFWELRTGILALHNSADTYPIEWHNKCYIRIYFT